MPDLTCTVVTPEQTALETKADFVALPLFDGEIGILANHSPLIGRLGFGEMRIKSGGQTAVYYVDGIRNQKYGARAQGSHGQRSNRSPCWDQPAFQVTAPIIGGDRSSEVPFLLRQSRCAMECLTAERDHDN